MPFLLFSIRDADDRRSTSSIIKGIAALFALYSTVKTVLRVVEWKTKDSRCRTQSGIPFLTVPEGDSVLVGHIADFKRNYHRVYDWRLEGFVQGKAMTVARAAAIWMVNPSVHTCDPLVVKHMLKDNFNNYIKTLDEPPVLQDLLGQGIFAINHGPHASDGGAMWTMQRKVAANIFTKSSFRGFMSEVFERHAFTLGKLLDEALKESAVIDMQSYMFK